jgi:hypothetical protein
MLIRQEWECAASIQGKRRNVVADYGVVKAAQHSPVQSNKPQSSCDLVLTFLSSAPSRAGYLEQFVDHEDPLNSVLHVPDNKG